MIEDPWFYAVAIPGVFLAGLSKAGVGSGLGMLAVPLMALMVKPQLAAAIMLPLLCSLDILSIRAYKQYVDWPLIKSLLPGALAGIVIGALCFKWVPVAWLLLILGVECLVFSLNRIIWAKKLAAAPAALRNPLKAFVAAMGSGFTSTIAHAGNPPIAQYMVPLKMPKLHYVGTTSVFFTAVNYTKLVPYSMLGLLELGNLSTSLILLPIVPIGFWVGRKIVHRISESLFYEILTWSLLLLGLRLLWQGIKGIVF